MKMKGACVVFSLIALLGLGFAQETKPVAVSPGGDREVARVSERCPTFSWSSLAWAVGYRVAVFEARTAEVKTYEIMALTAVPVLRQDIQGKALSWTPSTAEQLKDGGLYVWYVQARDASGNGLWSAGKAFLVEVDKTALVGVEERVTKRLRTRGVDGDVIAGAANDIESGTKARTVSKGFSLKGTVQTPAVIRAGDGGPGAIRTQGHETDTNTWYGLNAAAALDDIGSDGLSNTVIGNEAGYKTTDGDLNTFIGYQAGWKNTTGNHNTAIGDCTGYYNEIGSDNTMLGHTAGFYTSAGPNTFVGKEAGYANSSGTLNTLVGVGAGRYNGNNVQNTIVGHEAGYANTGSFCTFLGYRAGYNTDDADYNTFIGWRAGYTNSTGGYNTYLGTNAGLSGTAGSYNTMIGYQAGYSNTASSNTFLGYYSGYANTTGTYNTFFGQNAGRFNTSGSNNVILGLNSGYNNATGGNNTIIGVNAGFNIAGSGNVILGYRAGLNETGSNRLYISNSDAAFPLIYGNFGTALVAINGMLGVGIQAPTHPLHMASGAHCTAGGTWTNASSRSLKENIRALRAEDAQAALSQLAPVRFNYRADAGEECLGFIAEDVPSLVATGDRKGLSPMDIVAVLTKVVQEQQKTIDELRAKQKEIDDLRAEIEALKHKTQ